MTTGFARHRRSQHIICTFTGFEADLLRSLAAQLVELLRNEAAVPRDGADPFEALMDFSGPETEPDDPVLARLFPTAYPDDEEAAADVVAGLLEPDPESDEQPARASDDSSARTGSGATNRDLMPQSHPARSAVAPS